MSENDHVTMNVGEIEELAHDILCCAGTASGNARPLAKAIAAAEREGIASHGLLYLPIYVEHVQCGKVDGNAVPRLSATRAGTAVVDAATGFAHPAIALGFETLIPSARTQGIAALAIHNSYNCGVLGYHTQKLATKGLVGLGFTNAPASIAPVGGNKPVVGTNPFSLAVPDGQGGCAILIDQSASVVARSEVMKRAREGKPIAEGWALDADGNLTTDPAKALKGTMAPAGGYKGVGVGILTEVLAAALTGATLGIVASPFSGTSGGPPKTGQFFIAIDPTATSDGAPHSFASNIAGLVSAIADQEGARLPGEGRARAMARSDQHGIPVPKSLLDKIDAIAVR